MSRRALWPITLAVLVVVGVICIPTKRAAPAIADRIPHPAEALSDPPPGSHVRGLDNYADYRTIAMGRSERPAVLLAPGTTFARTVRVPRRGARYQSAVGAFDAEVPVRIAAAGLEYTFTARPGVWTPVTITLDSTNGEDQQIAVRVASTGAIAWATEVLTPNGPRAGTPDVVLISLDTTRPDHLSLYDPELPTTPKLASLLPDGMLFEQAISTTSWTMPAHAALFTGHLAADSLGFTSRVEPDELTLAERLAASGYRTFGVSGGPFTDSRSGFQQGFDEYIASGERENAGDAVARAVAFVDAVGDAPVLLFLNLFNAHEPLDLSPGVRTASGARDVPAGLWHALRTGATPLTPELRAHVTAAYHAEIAEMDRQLGELFAALEARQRWRDTLLVVWGDHGQLLGEGNRFGHGLTLDEELIRIPLFVRPPAGSTLAPGTYPHQFQNDDLYGLTLALAGVEHALGRTLLADVAAGRPVRQFAFAKLYHDPSPEVTADPRWRSARQWAVRDGRLKVVRDAEGRTTAYDVSHASGERPTGLPSASSPIMQALERFRAESGGSPRHTAAPLSPAERDRLRALGYIR